MTSGGNSFDFPENQLTVNFAFLCKSTWWNATVSPFPLSWYHLGEQHSPKNIWGNSIPLLFPSTTPLNVHNHSLYFIFLLLKV